MAVTYIAIQTTEVGSGGAANITFNSIPNTYTDLLIMISARSEAAGTFSDELMKINNSTSTYTNRYIYGNGSNVLGGTNAYTGSGGFIAGMVGNTSTANCFANKMVYIPNYLSSNSKVYIVNAASETSATTAYLHLLTGCRSEGTAITSIVLVTDSGVDYAQYTTATLYGIKNTV